MARSRTHLLPARRTSTSLTAAIAAAMVGLLVLAGCESGTQEPDAPEAEAVEFGAAPMAAPEASESSAAASRPAGSGSIDPSRFPEELPEGAQAAIPENFPSTMPIYPNASPSMGMSGAVNDAERSGMALLSNDSLADVVAFYQSNLDAGGWEITDTKVMGQNTAITATSDCGTTVLMLRASEDGGTDIYQVTQGC